MTMQTGSRRSHVRDREYYNPLRGLNVARCITLLEQYQRGEMADPQWAYYFIEQSDADLFAILERREAALLQLDWEVRIASGPGQPAKCDESLAREQAAVLRETYHGIDNLYEAIAHLQLATFRGFAHCEKVCNARGDLFHLELVDQWHVVRDSWRGGWKYNPQALSTNFDNLSDDLLLDPADFLIRERDRHVNRMALLKFIRANLSEKDWDAFIEIYGIPSGVIVGPPSVPPEQEAAYRSAAQAIAEGGSGYLPHGSDYQPNDSPRGTDPFRPRLDYLTEKLVLAGTGGLLTMLAQSGSGTLAGSAHQEAFNSIARGEARQISEILQRQLDREVLARHFPKRPVLAYFELVAHEPLDPGAVAEQARKFAAAGYRMERRQLEELSGYKLSDARAQHGQSDGATSHLLSRLANGIPIFNAERPFDESRHPRTPKGTAHGGEFVAKGSVAAPASAGATEAPHDATAPRATKPATKDDGYRKLHEAEQHALELEKQADAAKEATRKEYWAAEDRYKKGEISTQERDRLQATTKENLKETLERLKTEWFGIYNGFYDWVESQGLSQPWKRPVFQMRQRSFEVFGGFDPLLEFSAGGRVGQVSALEVLLAKLGLRKRQASSTGANEGTQKTPSAPAKNPTGTDAPKKVAPDGNSPANSKATAPPKTKAVTSETQGAITNLGSRPVQNNADLLRNLQKGKGMSGVFDHKTGRFVLRFSDDKESLPGGWVRRYGGHADVRTDLGAALGEDLSSAGRGRLSGFSVTKAEDGKIKFNWNSGTINDNSHGHRAVPEALRPSIEAAVRAALGQ